MEKNLKKRLTLMIYGTHCELVNGKIREVGNDYAVPSAIQQKAVKRYEPRMAARSSTHAVLRAARA